MHASTFTETQTFRQTWFWLAVTAAVLAGLMAAWGVGEQVHETGSFGAEDGLELGLIFFFISGMIWLGFGLRLDTEVREDGVYYRFRPFHRGFRSIRLADMESFETRVYRPILEYGGWGIRFNIKGHRAYNVSGNRGVQFVLKDGKHILIGTQKPDEMVDALKRRMTGSSP